MKNYLLGFMTGAWMATAVFLVWGWLQLSKDIDGILDVEDEVYTLHVFQN